MYNVTIDSDRRVEFERALVKHLRNTTSVAKIASQKLLEEINLKGGLEHVELQLGAFRLGKLQPTAPFFQAMVNRNRLDLTLEAFALQAEWQPLFSERNLQVARKRLKKHGYDPDMGGRSAPADFQPARTTKCLLSKAAKLIYFSVLDATLPNQLQQLEESLAAGGWGYPNVEHRVFIEETPRVAREYPNAVRQYQLFDRQFFETTVGLLSALETALDFSDKRVQIFLLNDRSDPGEYNLELLKKPANHRSREDQAECEEYEFAMQGERELLIWRAVCLGHFIGQRMSEYAATHRFDEDRWLIWRAGRGSKAASEFVSGLSDQHFQLLLTCEEIEAMLVLPSSRRDDSWLTLPSDGDLIPVDGALQVENTPDHRDWQELLGKVPDYIRPGYLLRACSLAADRTRQLERIQGLHATREITSETKGLLESVLAFQEPMRHLLEQIARSPDGITRATAAERLKSILGPVYNRLCPEARHALMSAEQVFHYPDFASPGDAIFGIARAFEVQLKQVVVPLFRDYLAENGVRQFPQQKKSLGGPIIVDGVFNKNRPLGHIKEALKCGEAELVKFCEGHGFDLINVLNSIEELLPYRNETAHGEALNLPTVTALYEKWLGVGVKHGGIFRFVVTGRFDPRLEGF